ncbi:MAG: hypothetical protein AMXMBFR64_32630 [Myxococcales bacterium]
MSTSVGRARWALAATVLGVWACDSGTTEPKVDSGATVDTASDVGSADVIVVVDTGVDAGPPADVAPDDVAETPEVAEDVAPPPECTPENADYKCNDNLPCTLDACVEGACVHDLKEPCCLSDADCDDGVACTVDECTPAHDCVHLFADSFCCLTDGDCTDQDDCTEDLCIGNGCVHPRASKDCPCATAADCDDGNPCSADACAGGKCVYGAAGGDGCCATAADCVTPGECLQAICVQYTCGSEPAKTKALWSATFSDGGIDGFEVDADGSGAKWQYHDSQAISLPGALYYGRLPEKDYDVGKTAGTALSPVVGPFDGDAVGLSLWIAPNVEPLFSVDHVRVEVRPVEGGPTVLWSKDDIKSGTISGWKQLELDITALAKAPFRIALVFDSVDGTNNHYEGVWADDVRVTVPCE